MSLLPTAQTHASSSSRPPSVLIVGAGRLGTWLAVKFALRERATMTMKKKATTTKQSEDDHETMTMMPRVVLKGSGRKSKEGQKTAMKRIVEKIVEEHDIAYVESYEDERLLRTVLSVGEEEGGKSETALASTSSKMLEFDYVFVTVKTYAFDAVVEEMNRAKIPVRPKVAVMLHNGIVEPIFKGLGDGYVPCVIPQSYDFVDASEDGKVGERYVIKVKNEEKPWAMPNTREAKSVHALLTTIGANSQPDENFEYTLLRKYFINCVANLLSIVGDCNCDGLLDTKELRNRMDVLYHEMYAALQPSHREGFAKMPEDFYDVVFSGLRTYGAHFPSTKLDFDAGALLEIDSLNGYVCARGRENGCPCLEHEKLIEEVKRLVRERDEKEKKKEKETTTT